MSERDIFTAALGHGEPAGRAAYLDKACEGNPALRARLELLLRAHERPDSLLDASGHAPAAAVPGELAREAGLGDGPTRTFGGSGSSGTGSTTDLTFLVPSSRPDSLGRIGHYDVLELLGRGGFGIVFRAFDDVLQRVVAVKVLTPQLAATSSARKRFLREARSSAAVRHENVVQVYAVEELPLPYLVMEFIPGETLQGRLRRTGPIEVLEIVRLGRQIALGLEAAHAQGLVHRDVKPGNVLIEARTPVCVKLTDFGLARAADDASISQSGIVAGTPMYISPEQARGGTLDHRSDLFSLGSVLYVMCTCRPPFRAEGTFAVLKRVVEDVPRPIREVIPETPEWLCQIIAKLHVKDPAGRFQTAREVADLFAACESCLETGSKFKDLLPVSPEPPVRTRKWQRVAAAALVLPLLLGGVFAWNWLANRSNTAAAPGDNSTEKGQVSGPEGTGDRATLAVAPFDDATAKEYQQFWAGRSGVPVESLNSIGMNMRVIPPGRYPNSAQPDRLITISKPFQMSAYETMVVQFRQFVNDTNYRTDAEKTGHGFVKHSDGALEEGPQFTWQHAGVAPGNDYPVGQLSWNDAMAFCRWLSQKEGKTYRLPTEAEWEWETTGLARKKLIEWHSGATWLGNCAAADVSTVAFAAIVW